MEIKNIKLISYFEKSVFFQYIQGEFEVREY